MMFVSRSVNRQTRCAAWLSLTAALAALLIAPSRARAVDKFEIQVYEADVNNPGQPGLEVHMNFTPAGQTTPSYVGEVPPDRTTRLTLEPAIGVTRWLELGAYLQFMMDGEGTAHWGGAKLRTKLVLPNQPAPFFFGINVELGRVPRTVDAEGWANEFRPIAGFYNGYILVDVNPIFGYALTGSDRFKPDFEPAGKVAVNTQLGFSLGFEYYAGLGLLSGLSPLRNQDHLLLLAFDLADPVRGAAQQSPWEVNVAVGRSLTDATPQDWVLKAIIGRPF